jgi:hypothetical protein
MRQKSVKNDSAKGLHQNDSNMIITRKIYANKYEIIEYHDGSTPTP